MTDKEIVERFSTRLRERREELKLTQADLARKCGAHAQGIWQWEHAYHEVGVCSAVKLAAALEVPVDWLLGLSDNKNI